MQTSNSVGWSCIVFAVGLILPACSSTRQEYPLKGQIIQKSMDSHEISLKHDEIPGFMPAMTMAYKVDDAEVVRHVEPGDLITATLIVGKDGGESWLDNVRILRPDGQSSDSAVLPARMLTLGEPAPPVELVNQDGRTIQLADFKGRAVLVTFMYTRCPVATFCPRLSDQFRQIHEALAKTPEDYAKTHLLSISIDPGFDAPEVLRKYGLGYLRNDASGFEHWDFAATAAARLRSLAEAFGLIYHEEGQPDSAHHGRRTYRPGRYRLPALGKRLDCPGVGRRRADGCARATPIVLALSTSCPDG